MNRRKRTLPNHSVVGVNSIVSLLLAILVHPCYAQTRVEPFNQVVQPYVDAGMFMGTVLVAKDGKPVFNRGYGMADLEWSVPNSPTTRFNIASMTKQFTAAAILLLEDRGKLKTDDLVKKYLPVAPASWDKITIYNLLTHTSGISVDAANYVPGTPDKLDFNDMPLNFQPGERWAYSNLGYIVLGYLLERISGQTYLEFVERNIFKPLGMNDSGMFSFGTVIPRRASGYWPRSNGIENADHFDPRLNFSTGSLYSTTEDLLRWENGLFAGKLLSPASLHKMIAPFKSDYGCGLYIKRMKSHLVIEHDGNNIGFNSHMAFYPEERITVIVLANLNGTVTGEIASALAAVARGEAPPIPSIHKEISLSKQIMARYLGTYQFANYSVKITPEANHLRVESANGGTFAIFAESETRFFVKAWPLRFEFSTDDHGQWTILTRYQNNKEEKGFKK
jgi:CubicO group peptidase (beta-lactamase class C family)